MNPTSDFGKIEYQRFSENFLGVWVDPKPIGCDIIDEMLSGVEKKALHCERPESKPNFERKNMYTLQKLVEDVLNNPKIRLIEMHPDDVKKFFIKLEPNIINTRLTPEKMVVEKEEKRYHYCVTKLGGFVYDCPVLWIHHSYHRYIIVPINATDTVAVGCVRVF